MSWKDKLQPASFRGVPFKIDSHEFSGGRRFVQNEYVQRDKPFSEDTGRKAREFSFDAYIVSQDYFAARDALITALEKEGPGELVHPYLGRLQVQPGAFRMRETKDEGGYVTFTLNFAEAGINEFPSSLVDNRRATGDVVTSLFDSINKEMDKVFSILDQPQFVVDSATKKVNDICDQLLGVATKVNSTEQGIASIHQRVSDLQNRVLDLLHTPEKLAQTIESALQSLQDALLGKPRQQVLAAQQFFAFGNDDKQFPVYTATRQQEFDNLDILNRLTQVSSIGQASIAAVDVPFESTEDAQVMRERLVDNIEFHLERTKSDDTFQNLQDLKVEIIRGVPPPDEQLPTIGKVRLLEPRPAIVESYDLYESANYEQDLIDRNKVINPGFLPTGKDLEVLQIE